MTLLYYDPIFLEHDTGSHPENAGRLIPVAKHLKSSGLEAKCTRPAWEPVSIDQLKRVHTQSHIDAVKRFADEGGGRIEADTIVSPHSYEVALHASGAACDAVTRVLDGQDTTALCLVRPPGHHAMNEHPMGFCLFNNIAVAARVATGEHDLDRVLIVDWDVHHGNGTQATFWEDAEVGFLSMHRFPFYPGTGSADETGAGAGKGTTMNLPIAFGTSRQAQLDRFRDSLGDFADELKPNLILVSAGFDSHKDDPIGSLGLESEDFTTLTRIVRDVAKTHCGGRVVSLLEGGYSPAALVECVDLHLRELLR